MIYLRCKQFPNYAIGDDGSVVSLIKDWHTLRPGLSGGYLKVTISDKQHAVHVLVLETFEGTRPDGLVANHIDGNKLNNRLDNLEWVTPSYNNVHAFQMGLAKQVGIVGYKRPN